VLLSLPICYYTEFLEVKIRVCIVNLVNRVQACYYISYDTCYFLPLILIVSVFIILILVFLAFRVALFQNPLYKRLNSFAPEQR